MLVSGLRQRERYHFQIKHRSQVVLVVLLVLLVLVVLLVVLVALVDKTVRCSRSWHWP